MVLNHLEFVFAHLRYSLEGNRPSQTTTHTSYCRAISERLSQHQYFNLASYNLHSRDNPRLLAILQKKINSQCVPIVKVHRVFPSCHWYSASSRKMQFRWDKAGDSKEVVTPLMRVRTYLTSNYATLGPSRLQPPFTDAFTRNYASLILYYQYRAGVKLYTLFCNFAESYVFNKQSPPSIVCNGCLINKKPQTTMLLIPKLRSNFAEFLQLCSLIRLSSLSTSSLVSVIGTVISILPFPEALHMAIII
jgi:hypothetical protein